MTICACASSSNDALAGEGGGKNKEGCVHPRPQPTLRTRSARRIRRLLVSALRPSSRAERFWPSLIFSSSIADASLLFRTIYLSHTMISYCLNHENCSDCYTCLSLVSLDSARLFSRNT